VIHLEVFRQPTDPLMLSFQRRKTAYCPFPFVGVLIYSSYVIRNDFCHPSSVLLRVNSYSARAQKKKEVSDSSILFPAYIVHIRIDAYLSMQNFYQMEKE